MKIFLAAERQAGLIGYLTLKVLGHDVIAVATHDPYIRNIASGSSIIFEDAHKIQDFKTAFDLLVNIQGRTIFTKRELETPLYGGINLHPCLWKYPGANPIRRLLADGEKKASVAAHIMTEKVDAGPVLVEKFIDIDGLKSEGEVYNRLYYLYPSVIRDAIESRGPRQ